MRRLLYLLSFLAFCLIPLTRVFAAGEFEANYDVQYAISPNGTTIVTQNVTLTNRLTNLYPQKYSIVIDSQQIKNVIAYDNGGMITPEITQKDSKTQIVLPFNDKIVGLGKSLPFTLRFENGDIAEKNGSIWEVNIPGVAKDTDIGSYMVSLSVPPTFGPNAYMSPLPASGNRWTKEQMMQGGISAAYGKEQLFDLTLTYFLQNTVLAPRLMELALPPDTAYQRVIIKSLEPKPKTVLRDADTNWLAQYDLLPGQLLEIKAIATIFISLKSKEGYKEALSNPEAYIQPLKYWETMDPQIAALAKQYKTPREIYNYVVNSLSYDYTRVNQNPVRKGAVSILANPKTAICMEFTDLFIAIARAAGIPAREAIGYAHTTNARLRPLSLISDVLHSWPEYYDAEKSLWIPIDPTWANTTGGVNYFDKLDFNHIVFALQGEKSDYPYPAGFYKKLGKTGKDVDVVFATTAPSIPGERIEATIQFPKTITSGFTTRGSVVFENMNGIPIDQIRYTIHSVPYDVALTKTETNIPPYAKISVPINMELPSYFAQGKGSITVTVNGQTKQLPFDISPFANRFVVPGAILLWVLLISLWIGIRLRTKAKQKR
jgi:transglutaminase-like putative cysteine protease